MLQSLFPEPLLQVTPLDPGYEDHASDVWRVETATGRFVVRASRLHGRPDNRFWGTLRLLFGVDPRRLEGLALRSRLLGEVSPIAIPQVHCIGMIEGRPHAVVDWVAGGQLAGFDGEGVLTSLGDYLGRVHSRTFPHLGAPDGLQIAPADWGAHLAATLPLVLERFFADEAELREALPGMVALVQSVPAPEGGVLSLPDFDATQFLGSAEGLTAMVDLESLVLAPPAFDLCGLELVLQPEQAAPFVAGYTRHRPLPELRTARPLYRFLHRLWEAQGNRPLATYLAYPALF